MRRCRSARSSSTRQAAAAIAASSPIATSRPETPCVHHVGNAAGVGADDRHPARERFQDRNRHVVDRARIEHAVGTLVERRHRRIVDPADELDRARDAQTVGEHAAGG